MLIYANENAVITSLFDYNGLFSFSKRFLIFIHVMEVFNLHRQPKCLGVDLIFRHDYSEMIGLLPVSVVLLTLLGILCNC